jgi:hypothetical protein
LRHVSKFCSTPHATFFNQGKSIFNQHDIHIPLILKV